MEKYVKTPPDSLTLTISDPVALLKEVADRYSSAERVLMEYVDNPLDDAEMLRNEADGEYPYKIYIKIHLNSKTRTMTIIDNCRGMNYKTLVRIVSNIGESTKRGCSWLNGRFGFGIHSFRAIAEGVTIRTKNQKESLYQISLKRDQLDGIEVFSLGDVSISEEFSTGTEITIDQIDSHIWKSLNPELLKNTIEQHFETILKRKNLEVVVQMDSEIEMLCEAFDYDQIDGEEFKHSFFVINGAQIYPVEMYLKVSKVAYKSLIPRFFAKGRRIHEMRAISSFINNSQGRTRIWGHDHLVGYIEVGEALTPTITRDDFKATKIRESVYSEILKFEEKIKESIEEINENHRDNQMNNLASVFSKVLSNFARADLLKLQSEQPSQVSGTGEPGTGEPGTGEPGTSEPGTSEPGTSEPGTSRPGTGRLGTNEPGTGRPGTSEPGTSEPGTSEPGTSRPGTGRLGTNEPGTGRPGTSEPGTSEPGTSEPGTSRPDYGDGVHGLSRIKRPREGLSVQFFKIQADYEGNIPRCSMVEGTIMINTAHPQFVNRVTQSRKGIFKMNDRLLNYICGVIAFHYKSAFYDRYGKQPEHRDQLFEDQFDFVNQLEDALLPHVYKLEERLNNNKDEVA